VIPNPSEDFSDPFGEWNAATRDTDEHNFAARLIPLGDFVGDAGKCPGDGGGVKNGDVFRHEEAMVDHGTSGNSPGRFEIGQ
jgi:hypothetical protein